jgi:hypothetical protein
MNRMERPPPPGPERDRRVAQRPRYAFRAAASIGDEISSFLGSEAFQRLRRFQRVNGALKAALGGAALAKLKAVQLKAGVLTIEVAEGPLLAELRQHAERTVLQALASAGTGVSKVVWRLARSQPMR